MLLSNPETYQALVEDPEKIPGAIDEVLRMADQALYEAKANGRNQLRRARPERTAA